LAHPLPAMPAAARDPLVVVEFISERLCLF
jgi:hypothetical protein